MGAACSAYVGEERCINCYGGETRGKESHLEDPDVNGKVNIKTALQEVGCDEMDWIDMA